jgi:hypothetical protein
MSSFSDKLQMTDVSTVNFLLVFVKFLSTNSMTSIGNRINEQLDNSEFMDWFPLCWGSPFLQTEHHVFCFVTLLMRGF